MIEGKIYKLVNNLDSSIYIGSTKSSLSRRFYKHKQSAKQEPTRNVYAHLVPIGWNNVRIILIENYVCQSNEELVAREQYFIDLLNPSLNKIASFGQKCEHDRIRNRCVDCGGSQICQHDRIRNQCIECGGSQICQHDRIRSRCVDCGGSQICQHDRIRSQCVDCGGSQICQHNRRINNCIECGGSQICQHSSRRMECVECSPVECDFCQKTYSKAKFSRHNRTTKHKLAYCAEFLRVFDMEMTLDEVPNY